MAPGSFPRSSAGQIQWTTLALAAFLAVAACGPFMQEKPNGQTAPAAVEKPELDPLDAALAGPWRESERARDVWRHPKETLRFFGVKPEYVVVEASPGAGWYTAILAPYLKSGGGKLYAATFPEADASEAQKETLANYKARFQDEAVFGRIEITSLGPATPGVAPDGSADVVLTFRNVHNWMAQSFAEKAFSDFYRALKPGGVLGVVEHRDHPSGDQDPKAKSGYVKETYVKQLAIEAGFEFVEASEINANPADTKDHPFGVWTLPPISRSSPLGQPPDPQFDGSKYLKIGESDRMTLKFRKPINAKEDGGLRGKTP